MFKLIKSAVKKAKAVQSGYKEAVLPLLDITPETPKLPGPVRYMDPKDCIKREDETLDEYYSRVPLYFREVETITKNYLGEPL